MRLGDNTAIHDAPQIRPAFIHPQMPRLFFFYVGHVPTRESFPPRRHVERRYFLLFLAEVACLDHPTCEAYLSRRWLG